MQRPRRDSNPQSSDPESDALSIRPRGPTSDTSTASLIKLLKAPAWCAEMRMLLPARSSAPRALWGRGCELEPRAERRPARSARTVHENWTPSSSPDEAAPAPPVLTGGLGALPPRGPEARWVRGCPLLPQPPRPRAVPITAPISLQCSVQSCGPRLDSDLREGRDRISRFPTAPARDAGGVRELRKRCGHRLPLLGTSTPA